MKTIYLILDATEKKDRYLGDCKGLTDSPEEAAAMLTRVKRENPGRKIHKMKVQITETEVWHSDEPIEACLIIPVYRPGKLMDDEE